MAHTRGLAPLVVAVLLATAACGRFQQQADAKVGDQNFKSADGYELDLVRGWVGTPDLSYPPDFWHGLGIRRTNVRRAPA
jgi:hypothetical protein